MPDSLARLIIDEAVALEKSRPDLTAMQVLDLVMRGRRGTSPDFGALAFPGPLDPSSPFGALLSHAFDEQVTFSGVRSAAGGGPNAFEEYWLERVMRAFSARYGLHKPR
jgi:hypothetical protein